ncbi:MAG: hypothetical protein JXN61_04145 [Sedimentisphaerales bacterium]|nr:hypothetical protein [Sedimentisphaerales bacterium]
MKNTTVKAVHDADLEKLLRSLGLWEKMNRDQLLCAFCGTKISPANLGCIIPKDKQISVCCDSINCYEKIVECGE